MTQPLERPKATGIGIAVAVLLALLEIYAAYGGVRLAVYIVGGGSNVTFYTYMSVVAGLLAIVVLVGVAMIFARRQAVGRVLFWAAPVQLLCAVSVLSVSSLWGGVVAYGVMTVLAVVLWLPAVSAKTPPPVGYGMPYGGPVPMGQQYPGQQYPPPGPVPPQYPQQYGTPPQYPQQPYPQQPYPQQQPYPPQPMPGQPPQPPQGWPGR